MKQWWVCSSHCNVLPVSYQIYGNLPISTATPPNGRYQIYCLVTDAQVCEQIVYGHYMNVEQQPRVEPASPVF